MNMKLSKEKMLEIAERKEKCIKCEKQSCFNCENFVCANKVWREEVAFYEQIRELMQADAEGRMVVLPVRLGEKCSVRRIAEETTIVDGILQYATLVVFTEKEDMLMHPCNVFANREEAEAALNNMGGESCV